MRIVSLLPSATEIVAALGLEGQLVGISHRCDYPPEVEALPRLTAPARPDAPGALVAQQLGRWTLDAAGLAALRPDLVLYGAVRDADRAAQEAIREAAGEEATIVSVEPLSLEGIFHSVTTIGSMTEAEDEAVGLIEVLREDLGGLEERAMKRYDEGVSRRRVVVLEALDPPFASGRWVPEQVRRAGGWELLGREGEPSAETRWESVRDVDPEVLVLAPAGMALDEAAAAWRALDKGPFLADLDAVRRGQVFAVEPVYFERPGPRIVDGVALLAEIFDPEAFGEAAPAGSWMALEA